jgi:hypothetical protein
MPNDKMPEINLLDLFQRLRGSGFRDFSGARVTAHVPISEALLNELIAASIPPNAPVRGVSIRPDAGNHFSVRVVPKAALLPAITLKLAVERQPELPSTPVLVLRMVTLGGLFGLASGAITGLLPPGVTLQGERILVDLHTIAAQRGAAEAFQYLSALQVATEPGRLVLHVDAGVR